MWVFRCLFVLYGAGVYFTTQASTPQQEENLALRGKTVQSSNYHPYVAAYAIDGQPSTFSSTAASTDNPWWRLDLLDSYHIAEIVITNRVSCCGERLNGAEIHIGNSLENNGNNNPRCAVLGAVVTAQSVSLFCGGMRGRYVNVIIPGSQKILSLAEVQVYKKVYQAVMSLKFISSLNVADPAESGKLLYQMTTVLLSKGHSNFTLTWKKLPQKVKPKSKQVYELYVRAKARIQVSGMVVRSPTMM
ncbi:fucolectin-like [Triplophysa rosa]|uniref:fucolectin-like n=1 Tax=Triplophysa rosa TaxID=992332 RepID=UPI002545E595|nr:fucolectin-like [Triplophysa rosa]